MSRPINRVGWGIVSVGSRYVSDCNVSTQVQYGISDAIAWVDAIMVYSGVPRIV